ncbi:hypothetical protein Pyn_36646 [Prunus yedoensis var. nudiflora]|uniref:Uncharacterized protein n=1 Tax=Prunus yedoensis var. nudiflora TaxID=2094558 RepID=A0A314YW84_PRUYE|nr:hypothetical protein Pyn_36646 [Prunus yedoensis var. nudiflora]
MKVPIKQKSEDPVQYPVRLGDMIPLVITMTGVHQGFFKLSLTRLVKLLQSMDDVELEQGEKEGSADY